TKDKVVDVSKAVRDLNHSPRIVLEEGIAATLKWMRQVYRV
ncbi:MAG: nucleoside-diphosphate sugar epimerase, partial [Acidobacteria bacterium]